MARIMVLEKGLEDRVEIVEAQTRRPDSPYYEINPSGRVPCLVRDDGIGMEESAAICAYLDYLDGAPTFDPPPDEAGWEIRRLEAAARSMLDGVALWGREYLYRSENERSPTIIAHETERAKRMFDFFEAEIDSPALRGDFNMAQMTLACTVLLDYSRRGFEWRRDCPKLAAWADEMAERPSIEATTPPTAA
jgi:glutathione S-transferase